MDPDDTLPVLARQTLANANVNPDTLLATDYLNPFNEYVMLADLVESGMADHDILLDWQPVEYEAHFFNSAFAKAEVVIAAYHLMQTSDRCHFQDEVAALISNIHDHQNPASPTDATLGDIKTQRDVVAAIIAGRSGISSASDTNQQAQIDALFA